MTSTAAPAADFSCAICLDTATEPVVTRCGHLFCWECLDHWLHSPAGVPECPVCKGRVDERIAGDIIPLYGKGKHAANKPASGPSAAAPTAATTAADPSQEEFFSRPSAYSFAPAREARHAPAASPAASAAATHAAPQTEDGEHHPRPAADRAPPRPRPAQQYQNMQMHVHNPGMPLTVGSSVFFFGGGGGMFFSIMLIIAWAVYSYAPWRQWRVDVERWYNHAREHPASEERRDDVPANTAPPAPSATNSNTNQSTPPDAVPSETANELPSLQVVARNLGFTVLAIFVLFQLLLFM
ncbi:hypothetical protein ABB37_05123 [Leptomonas pyrrhocoris]|uniref:RING-type E3 ubiquitin transferase n=1 Tax=Leptomonas pyrrhocoris TaxID=157538 RepID=A0A0N0DVI2_LEPPY|nr:hypothetical protein ABB37_05123 [Leptomonas pyrrhocoris]KPA80131.1 hypothetical protein ABB37_05123 [Leptomonas pyrrhocoris]|eukprot:XP_015658570.1 hypothetical protein ABB37_05123 [Leptomonas pyrrhocoris]